MISHASGLPSSLRLRPWPVMAVLATICLLWSIPAYAQRVSNADRLTALEQQLAASRSGNVELLNQLTTIRNELQSLRGQLEDMQESMRQQQQAQRIQALDADSRLSRLEQGAGSNPAPQAASTPPTSGTVASTPANPPPPVVATPPPPQVPPSVLAIAERDDPPPRVHGDPGLIAASESERGDYNIAFNALKAGLYADAARLFRGFLQTYPGGTYAPNAFYWLGESYYVTQNYALAEEQFRELMERFPTHDKAAGALLKIGLSQQGLRQLDAAEKTLAEVLARYPDTEAARTADDRLRALQLSRLQQR